MRYDQEFEPIGDWKPGHKDPINFRDDMEENCTKTDEMLEEE